MRQVRPDLLKNILIGAGVFLIFFAVLLLGLGAWEGFGSVRENVHMVTVPGFHQIEFKSAGQYVGLYQHSRKGPVPLKILQQMEYHIIPKEGAQEVPLTKNATPDIKGQFGQESVMLFSFFIEQAGEYSLSGFYMGDEKDVQEMPVILFGQGAQGLKQSLIIGALFFLLFLGLGIAALIQAKKIGAPPVQRPVVPGGKK